MITTESTSKRSGTPARGDSTEKYNVRLHDILESAAHLFAKKGYHNTSIRDLASELGTSLAGLYYYFETKEDLLFLISQNSFDSVMSSLDKKFSMEHRPHEKLRILVVNHMQYFVSHLDAMKVLAHESESLSGSYYEIITEKKKKYIKLVEQLLMDVLRNERTRVPKRTTREIKIAALSLFGMMNWTYTWYDPDRRNGSAHIQKIANEMVDLFLRGFTAHFCTT